MNAQKQKSATKRISLMGIQKLFFRTQLVLIISLALILGVAGTLINIHFENQKRDQNLQNVAEAIAQSPILTGKGATDIEDKEIFSEYLDTLKDTLDDIDVISVVNKDGIRMYHSNHALIDTKYDGNMPDFESNTDRYYAVDENGPSGSQRRAYAAVYNEDGEYIGVVMSIMLPLVTALSDFSFLKKSNIAISFLIKISDCLSKFKNL